MQRKNDEKNPEKKERFMNRQSQSEHNGQAVQYDIQKIKDDKLRNLFDVFFNTLGKVTGSFPWKGGNRRTEDLWQKLPFQ